MIMATIVANTRGFEQATPTDFFIHSSFRLTDCNVFWANTTFSSRGFARWSGCSNSPTALSVRFTVSPVKTKIAGDTRFRFFPLRFPIRHPFSSGAFEADLQSRQIVEGRGALGALRLFSAEREQAVDHRVQHSHLITAQDELELAYRLVQRLNALPLERLQTPQQDVALSLGPEPGERILVGRSGGSLGAALPVRGSGETAARCSS